MPKPTTKGLRCVLFHLCRKSSRAGASPKLDRAPVTPFTETQYEKSLDMDSRYRILSLVVVGAIKKILLIRVLERKSPPFVAFLGEQIGNDDSIYSALFCILKKSFHSIPKNRIYITHQHHRDLGRLPQLPSPIPIFRRFSRRS